MKILNGKQTAQNIEQEIAQEVQQRLASGERPPHLVAILVGENPASLTYVNAKVKACQRVGFASSLLRLPAEITQEDLLGEIGKLNENPQIDGFIVQLPLPKHIDEQRVLLEVSPHKDVDGFHPTNFGRMALGLPAFIPATPFGILELLGRYQIPTQRKNVVVVGRSDIVGRPISILLSQKPWNATVTLTHSHTENLPEITQKADIIVVAIGKPNFLQGEMIKAGATVIDVGINRIPDASHPKGYRIVGDVDFDSVSPRAGYITPVPGGVGPMTIAMLMKNTLLATHGG